MTISILGCGWFGFALAQLLIKQSINVKGSTTSAHKLALMADAKIQPYLIDLPTFNSDIDLSFFECDVLIVAIPPKSRSGEGDLYLNKMQSIIEAVKNFRVNRIIFISSTGVYQDSNQTLTETDEPVPDTASGKTLLQAEKLFQSETNFKTTIIRFGGLVGPGRDPGRFFAGKQNIPNGRAPVNLIHLNDCIGICQTVIKEQAYGQIINACSPHHPPKQEFYKQAAVKSRLPLPVFVDELQSWKIVDSLIVQNVLHYQFKVSNWFEWLHEM